MGSQPHFVERYERYVSDLLSRHTREDAMSMAVGGGYDQIGSIEANILIRLGLRAGHSIIDLGCGSGRLATVLGHRMGDSIDYIGIDIVQALLDYAAGRAPLSYRFLLHRELSIPASAGSADFVVAFSVFTHLRGRETFAYIADARRTLRPGGAIVFSFLTLRHDWRIILRALPQPLLDRHLPYTTFTPRRTIKRWAQELDLILEQLIPPVELGQAIAVLRRP
jgi:ubiquinone/menaquinone biosynthesis C-methylase UbiE